MRHLVLSLVALAACTTEEEVAPVDPIQLNVTLENISAAGALSTSDGGASDLLFAPGILIVHDDSFRLFEEGEAASLDGLEAMVEDGSNEVLITGLQGAAGIVEASAFSALDASYNSAPMLPGDRAKLSIFAVPGDLLTVASMFGESNDVFVAVQGLPLFDDEGLPIDYAGSEMLGLWDAGTELNQEPGLGEDQAPRQADVNSGADEGGVVMAIDGTDLAGYSYPAVDQMLSLSIAPGG